MKYTYSDEEDDVYSDSTGRRSTRNTGTHTPAEPSGPTITQSGRQVKSRHGGPYGESMLSGTGATYTVDSEEANGEPGHSESTGGRLARRGAVTHGQYSKAASGRHIEGYNDVDEMTSDEEDDASEQDYGDDEEEDVPLESDVDDQDELSDPDEDEEMNHEEPKKLIVKLPINTPAPEQKSLIKLKISSQTDKDVSKTPASATTNDISAPDPPLETPQSTLVSDPGSVEVKENVELATTNGHEDPPKLTALSPKSPLHPAPQSPLAFRGSPEKPVVY